MSDKAINYPKENRYTSDDVSDEGETSSDDELTVGSNTSELNSSSSEAEELDDSSDGFNSNDDTSQDEHGSTSAETVEASSGQANFTAAGSDFISSLMRTIINEKIMELLELPEVVNFLRAQNENVPQSESPSKN